MDKQFSTKEKILLGIIAITGWIALLLQLYLSVQDSIVSLPETIIRYLSFFTIWINLIVTVCCTVLLVKKEGRWFNFFSNPKALTAITAYITLGGIVYNLVLRQLWAPQGLHRIADELLHLIIPGLFLLYWLLYVPKEGLKFKDIPAWLLFPFGYLFFALSRGALSGFYPYPFLDVADLGFGKVLLNSAGLAAAIAVFSFLFVAIAKMLSRKTIH